jgi:hypothetical protein
VLGPALRRPRQLCSHRCHAGLARCGARLARRRLPGPKRSTKTSAHGTWLGSRISPAYARLQPVACACGRVGLWAGLRSRLGRLAASFGCLGRRCVARGCCACTGAVRALRDAARGWLAGVCRGRSVQPSPRLMERGLGQDSFLRMLACSPSRARAGVWGCGLAFGPASGAWPLRVLGPALRRPRQLCSHRCRAGLARCGARLARRRFPGQ